MNAVDALKKSGATEVYVFITHAVLSGDAANKIKKSKIKNKGVLVKFPKKKQDKRLDLPTIGLNTLKKCNLAGLKGIVLKHKNNIFLDKIKSIKFANKNKMFILVK